MGALSGLERIIVWALKKTKPEKKDSRFVKGLEYSLSGIAYPIIGALPAELQKREAKKTGVNPLKFTKYSIGVTVLTGCAKYLIGQEAGDVPTLENFSTWFVYWTLIGNITSIAIRGSYVKIKEKPIGSLILEGIYYMMPSKIIGKYEKRNGTTTLQQKG